MRHPLRCTTHPLRQAGIAALLAGAVALPSGAAPLQLTSAAGANSFGASISDDGSKVAFYSASNLTGANPDNSFEIFLYDRYTDALRQVSHFAGGHLAGGNQVPVISGDGTRIVYQHFTTSGGTGFFQTVYHDLATDSTRTITAPSNFGETNTLSGDGRTIAVATGNVGLRLYDIASGSFGGLLAGNTFGNALSRDGGLLAIEGFGNLTLANLAQGTTVTVAGAGAGFNLRPDFSGDGRSLVFTSGFNPLGTNADGNAEIFVYDVAGASLRQITHTTGATQAGVSVSADGGRIAFTSDADLVGDNADHNQEVFFYDVLDDRYTQVTRTAGGGRFSVEPSLSGDGRWLAYTSSGNLSGDNPNGIPQIFLEELAGRGPAVPEPSTLALLGAAALGLRWARRGRRRTRPAPAPTS